MKERWQLLKERGDETLSDLLGEEPDLEFILELLGPGKLPPASAKALAALTWGVLPTSEWLSMHGWRNPCSCPQCGRACGAAHLLFGCDSAGSCGQKTAKK